MSKELADSSHICQFHQSFSEMKELLLPFLAEGLALGQHCRLVATSEALADDWLLELQAYGIDVPAETERGSLNVVYGNTRGDPEEFNTILRSRKG